MHFTDFFIRRPVFASVLSLLLLLLGLRALQILPVREFPETKNTVITITTTYPGAGADLINGFITTPIQQSVAGAEGVDYLTASSKAGVSTIEVHIRLNFDPNTAMTQVMSKVAEVRNILPTEAEAPVIQQSTGQRVALMYLSFFSRQMSAEQITDYLSRVVQPKLQTIPGVAQAEVLGSHTFAMRIWLEPKQLAALGVTPADVTQALLRNSFLTAAGETKGEYTAISIGATTDLQSAEGYRNLIIKNSGASLVRLGEVARVELGAENYDSTVSFNGQQAVFIAITTTPNGNPLSVINQVRDALPAIWQALPPTLQSKVVYDGSQYIRASIGEVEKTLLEATLIVVAVIFAFLGSLRAMTIPIIAIPLSLIGAALIMAILGYSLNLLTLLAMVLAIGLVVDDAIVVVENVHRHIQTGETPMVAALHGAREIAGPVIAMTLTLAAVYAPIGFMGGLTGSLFSEFAFTLAGAVLVSGFIALTLSPMMSSKVLKPAASEGRLERWVERQSAWWREQYRRVLHDTLDYRPVTVVFTIGVLVSCYFLYTTARHELAPTEDQSALFVSATGPQDATLKYMTTFTDQFNGVYRSLPETEGYFIVTGLGAVNSAISGLILKPWDQRRRSQSELQPIVQQRLGNIAGLKSAVFPLPSLPAGGGGLPVQFVISATAPYRQVYEVSQQILQQAQRSGLFMFLDTDLKYNTPKIEVEIARDKAAAIGLQMDDIGSALATLLGGNYVNRFNLEGRSYKVIPQVPQSARNDPEQLKHYYVKSISGELVPLSTVVSLKQTVQPNQLNQFQQLNAATIQGVPRPGVTLGDALSHLQALAAHHLPAGFSVNYAGESRQYVQEGQALLYTFFFALVVIYLVLAAQFESFRDPLIILISVPLSLSGALIFLNLGVATVNIYTQVGLVTLIGLISKHGILIVNFANQLQRERGWERRRAVEEAAAIRLRPILMTTAAMVLGVTPLLLASGAGAVSRFDIGLVIGAGMLFGTLFTLFVVPAMYTLLARKHHRAEPVPD